MAWWKSLFVLLLGIGLAYWWLSDDMLHTLKGKRVLVTGSSSGIGEQLAYHYARLGANVVVTGRRVEKLTKVVKECKILSPSSDTKHFSVSGDMSNLNDTRRLIEQATKHMGGLDILVLNHIKPPHRGAFEGTVEDLQELDAALHVDFRSYVHLTAHALPQLLANNGSIIIVNSLAGVAPPTYFSSYSAAKHALNGFFHSLRSQFVELSQDVSVTSCYLGLIGTEPVLDSLKTSRGSIMKDYLVVPACPKKTALDIVRGGARRQDEVFSPYLSSRLIHVLRSIFPELIDATLRRMSSIFEE